jgi:hypothetical protein
MSNDKYKGYFLQQRVLKNLETNTWEKMYVLTDENRLVGIFEDDTFANRYWVSKYLSSKRTEVRVNNTYDMEAQYEVRK